MYNDCIFCRIVAGESPAHIVYENEHTMSFAPLREHITTRGRLLIIPKPHYVNIFDIPLDEFHHIMNTTKYISQTLKEEYGISGARITFNNGAESGQEIFHFHVHLVPYYSRECPKPYNDRDFERVYGEIERLLRS